MVKKTDGKSCPETWLPDKRLTVKEIDVQSVNADSRLRHGGGAGEPTVAGSDALYRPHYDIAALTFHIHWNDCLDRIEHVGSITLEVKLAIYTHSGER